jgi:twitching motility protein PilT
MIANSAVRNLIREGKTFQLPSVIQLGSKDGMQTLNGTLADLVKKRVVTLEEACMKTGNEDGLLKLVPV